MTDIFTAIILLFVVVDPVGNIPLFMAVTSRLDPTHRRRVLLASVAVASGVLALFALFGIQLLGYFGVGIADFMVASGAILATFSMYYLLRPYEYAPAAEGVEVAVVPLAVPFLAGPASISYVLVISQQMGALTALAIIAIVSLLTLITLLASGYIMKVLGILGIRVIEKLMLILSMTIGVSLIRRGVSMWLQVPTV